MVAVIKTDGGRSHGKAVSSAVVFQYKNDDDLHRDGNCIGTITTRFNGTTNEAELNAIWLGLKLLRHCVDLKKEPKIYLMSDSELCINLVKGIYRCHAENLKEKLQWIQEDLHLLVVQWGMDINVQWISRDLNEYADRVGRQV